MNWRRWNNIIHRDLGYIAFGLTIVYAVSGIFLNHKRDLNPNYIIGNRVFELRTNLLDTNISINVINNILKTNGFSQKYTGYFKPEPGVVQVFYPGKTVTFDLNTRKGNVEIVKNRSIVKEMNYLHLNTPGKLWTWFADIYAVMLILLAITGLFVLKGKNGIKGRGAWLTALGLSIPVIFVIIYTL